MASRKELMEKYQGNETTPKKKKARGAFGVELRKLQEKAGVLESKKTVQKKEAFEEKVEALVPQKRDIPIEASTPKVALETELKGRVDLKKKTEKPKKAKTEIYDRDGFAISLLSFVNSEKASTVRFMLYLLSDDCPIDGDKFYHITQDDAGLDRTSFTYAKLSLKATGSFFETKVSSAEGGRPRLAYKFDKEAFYNFVLNQG